MALNKRRVREWAKDLTSRKYKQGTGVLCRADDKVCEHCCLGVATDRYINSKAGKANNARWMDRSSGGVIQMFISDDEPMGVVGHLPKEVIAWYGLSESDPKLTDSNSAISLNDLVGLKFYQIAKHIRRYLLKEKV